MITSKAEITKQTLVKIDDMENVISTIDWIVTIDVGTRVTKHAGHSKLQAPTESFINFSELTEAKKIEWALAEHGGQDAFVTRVVGILNEMGDSISSEVTIPAPLPILDTFKLRKVVV